MEEEDRLSPTCTAPGRPSPKPLAQTRHFADLDAATKVP